MQQDNFDPYRKWLGIQPKDQPPNHYRLLALELFEDDPDTISNAADRQMAHLRTFQTGPHSKLSQRLLNECAAARVCLLNKDAKASYDADLRAKASAAAKADPSKQTALPSTAAKPARALPVAQPLATPKAPAAPRPGAPRAGAPGPNAKLPQARAAPRVAGSDVPVLIDVARQPSGTKQRSRRIAPLAAAGALIIAVIVMSARNSDQGVPAGTPQAAAIAPTSSSAKSDPAQLAQDTTIPEPVTAPAASPMPPSTRDAGEQSDVAADADAPKADAARRSEGRDADMRDEASETAPLKPPADVPDFFTEDDSDAAEPKAPSLGADEEFFSGDDEMPAQPVGDGKDFFDSEN